jgi:hypothetical protein
MSGPAVGLYAPLPDLWNDASASKLDEPNLLLERSVYPEDIAEAAYYFASDLSAKSTGNVLNVDRRQRGELRAVAEVRTRGRPAGKGRREEPCRIAFLTR